MNKMAVDGEKMSNEETSANIADRSKGERVSGLYSYAGSSEQKSVVGASMETGSQEYRTIHERLQEARASKTKLPNERKAMKGPSPVKDIGKLRKGRKIPKVGVAEQLSSMKEQGLKVDTNPLFVSEEVGAASTVAVEGTGTSQVEVEGGSDAHKLEKPGAGRGNLTGAHGEPRQGQ
ncbi:unnamed protein product [Urochloa humidicola]